MDPIDSGTQSVLMTMEDSRLSVFNGTNPFGDDSRMGRCSSLMPEELSEWRSGGNSNASLLSGELLSSSRGVSLDGLSLDVQSLAPVSRGCLLAPDGPSSQYSKRSLDDAGLDAQALPQAISASSFDVGRPDGPSVLVQWLQAESSNSSSDGAVSTLAGPSAATGLNAYAATMGRGGSKGKGSGGIGKRGSKESVKGAKAAQAGAEGDSGGKLSGMWTAEENHVFFDALATHGRSFPTIHALLQATKTREQVRCYYYRIIKKINQIIAPSGTRLNKSTGSTEGVGVIEAILSWWKTVRGGNNDDTSANLFKKSAALTDQERDDFIKYVKEASISTASSSAHATHAKATVTKAAPQSEQACSTTTTASPAGSPRACVSVKEDDQSQGYDLYCTEVMHPVADPASTPCSGSLAVSGKCETLGLALSPSLVRQLCQQAPGSPASIQQETIDLSRSHTSSFHMDRFPCNGVESAAAHCNGSGLEPRRKPAQQQRQEQANAASSLQQHRMSSDLAANYRWAEGQTQQTPLKHERVQSVAQSPSDSVSHAASSPGGMSQYEIGASGYIGPEGTPRLKLKLTAAHPALAQLIERCGFNALLQLTFKPGGKSMGSIASHLGSKWGAAVHQELLYLMPHRMHVSVLPTFLLNSSNGDGGLITWSSSDRSVQASDVYVDFGQPKVFQLSYSLRGLDAPMLEALALKMARYPPGHNVQQSQCPPGAAGNADWVGEADVNISGDTRGRVSGHAPVPRLHRTSEATGDTRTASMQPECMWAQQGQVGGNDAVTSRVGSAASASCLFSGVTVSGKAGIHFKSPPGNTMVNIVDFVPFLHHRNHSAGTANVAMDDQSVKKEESRDPNDFSDIVQDTQDGGSVLAQSQSRFAGSQHVCSRDASSVSLGAGLKNPAPPCTLAPHTLISPPRESQPFFSQPSNSRAGGGDGGLLSVDDGLLGQLATSGREMRILAPGGAESRDAFCTGVSQGALCLLAHAGAGDDHNSMHAVLEHSRPGHLGNTCGTIIHDAAEANPSLVSRPALFEGTQILEKCHEDSQLERLLPDHTCESGLLGDNSLDSFGLMKRGREELPECSSWQRNIKYA